MTVEENALAVEIRPPVRRVGEGRFLLGVLGFRLVARKGMTPVGLVFMAIGLAGVVAVGVLGLDRIPWPLCMFKALTGIPCPTCGSTRVLGRVAALDFVGAVTMNPLAVGAGVALVLWGVGDLLLLRRGEALTVETGPRLAFVLRVTAVLAVLVNWAWLIVAGR